MRERKTDFLEEKITNYQMRIFRQELAADQVKELFAMISIVKDMESIGDVIDKNMIPINPKNQALIKDFSTEGKDELQIYHTKVCKQISRLKHAFAERDIKKASKIMEKEEKYLDLESLWCRRLIN